MCGSPWIIVRAKHVIRIRKLSTRNQTTGTKILVGPSARWSMWWHWISCPRRRSSYCGNPPRFSGKTMCEQFRGSWTFSYCAISTLRTTLTKCSSSCSNTSISSSSSSILISSSRFHSLKQRKYATSVQSNPNMIHICNPFEMKKLCRNAVNTWKCSNSIEPNTVHSLFLFFIAYC